MALILGLACGPAMAAEPLPNLPGQDAMPPVEIRVIRDIQNKAYGAPSLPSDAPKPEALLALSDLGSMAASADPQNAKLRQDDYDALFALLQRYRDDLLKMGMDGAELQAQMESLQARTDELELRLKNLQPRDGLKIYGRFYSAFDDLHLYGPAAISAKMFLGNSVVNSLPDGSTPPTAKTKGLGIRNQLGVAYASLRLEGTRGPVSARGIIDFQELWGFNIAAMNIRRASLEWRTPVVLEFGDLDSSVTPLTLWRNDQYQPFEPTIAKDRRRRMEDDLLLKADQWPMTGLRMSTDLVLFKSATVHLMDTIGVAAYATGVAPAGVFPASPVVYFGPSQTNGGVVSLVVPSNTYFDDWRVELPLGGTEAWSLAYNGMYFWNEADTSPYSIFFMPMHESVQSVDVAFKGGHFSASIEAAMSHFQQPYLAGSAQAAAPPMTGTAFTVDAKWARDGGFVRAFGRMVSSGFHASGAQGRTVDYNYQVSGPFLTENSQLGTNGMSGLVFGGGGQAIPQSYASRLNAKLIPAGVLTRNGASVGTTNPWRHLLAYGPGEEIDPYGAATPNRAGAGLEGDWKFFKGLLEPRASAEFFRESDNVPITGTALVIGKPFAMTRYRAGLRVDLEPWLGWPVSFGGGATMTDASNGQTDGLGNSYDLSTSTMEGSLDWMAGKPWGASLGYRSMVAQGQDEAWIFPAGKSQTWSEIIGGLWWRPQESMSLDVNYTSEQATFFGQEPGTLAIDEFVIRATLEF